MKENLREKSFERLEKIKNSENEIKITYSKPSAEEYVHLRILSGMGSKDIKRSEIALNNSLFTVSIYQDISLIAFGRVIGDGGITFTVTDIMVDKAFQGKGLGNLVMEEIDKYLEKNTFEDSYVCLIANFPADKLYSKYRFKYLDEKRVGMLRDQK